MIVCNMGASLYEPINVYKPVAPNIGIVDGPFEYLTVGGAKMPLESAKPAYMRTLGGRVANAGIGRSHALCHNWSDVFWSGMPMLRRLIVFAVTLLSIFGGQAAAQEVIGAVSRIQGKASGMHDGAAEALDLKSSVFLNEVVSTGEAARLEVTFTDRTQVTLGEKAELRLDTFVFNPAAGSGTIKFRAVGAFRFLSGQASKLARSDVSMTTPAAAVGIRGTDFWAGPIDNQALGVFLIEGAVSVSNAAGEQILSEPGQGTNIATPGAAPGPVTFWPRDKVDRAIAAVTFQ
jgi:hypothetical protein